MTTDTEETDEKMPQFGLIKIGSQREGDRYVTVVRIMGQRIVLDRDAAVAWAVTVHAAADRADHLHAAYRVLREGLDMPFWMAARFVDEKLLPALPLLDNLTTAPMRFESAIDPERPLVRLRFVYNGKDAVAEVTPSDVRDLATAVLSASTGAEAEQTLFDLLIREINVEPEAAEALVHHVGAHRTKGTTVMGGNAATRLAALLAALHEAHEHADEAPGMDLSDVLRKAKDEG